MIATIVNAVHFLHSHGIAHRDLKPANLLMKDESENSNLCLVDFGAGFVMDSKPALKSGNGAPEDTTRHASLHRQSMKTITGTPFYLAPEIVVGQPYSTKVDLWSVGCIAYQLLVGVTPFQSSPSFDQLYQRIVAAEYSFPEDIPLSDLAKDFVRSLLVPNPELRSSAGQAMRHPWIRQAVPPGYLLLLLEFNHEANPRLFAPPSLEVLDGDSLWGLVPTAAPDLHPRQPSDVEGSLGRSVKTRWEQQGRPGVLQVPTQGNELEPDPIDSEAQPPMSTPQHPDLYDPSNRPRTASEGYSYSPQFLFPAPEYQPQHPQYAQQYASPQPYGIFTPGHPNSWTPLYAHPESLGHLESGNLSQVELGDRLGGEEARDSPDSQTQAQGDELVRVRGLLQDLVGFGVGERRF